MEWLAFQLLRFETKQKKISIMFVHTNMQNRTNNVLLPSKIISLLIYDYTLYNNI